MPRKTQFTKEDVVTAAFELVREKGLPGLSAPAVAAKMGCSTMPIYSHFKNMQALEDAVIQKAWRGVMQYQTQNYTGDVWVDQAVGWVRFSRDEANLFHSMLNNNNRKLQYQMQVQHWEYLAGLLEGYDGFKDLDNFLSQRVRSAHAKLTHGLAMAPRIGPEKMIVEEDEILFRYLTSATQALLIGYKQLPPMDESYKRYVLDRIKNFKDDN